MPEDLERLTDHELRRLRAEWFEQLPDARAIVRVSTIDREIVRRMGFSPSEGLRLKKR